MKSFGLDALSISQRLVLVEELWDSIAVTPDAVPLTDAQKHDLDRRLEAYRDNPTAGATWDEVQSRLRDKT
jgi:putative addiction module component (TIGR02574 family)